MKTLKTIRVFAKIGRVISAVVYVASIVAFCLCALGILLLPLGGGELFKLGGVSVYGLLGMGDGAGFKAVYSTLIGGCIIFGGHAVVAGFAKKYFKNELAAGTLFTFEGARELLRLGILDLSVNFGCVIFANIVLSIVSAIADRSFDLSNSLVGGDISVARGLMLIILSLFCKLGAESTVSKETD